MMVPTDHIQPLAQIALKQADDLGDQVPFDSGVKATIDAVKASGHDETSAWVIGLLIYGNRALIREATAPWRAQAGG